MSKKIVINSTLIKTLTPKEKTYELRDSRLTGFIIRVYPSGKMVYVCQYGRGKRMNIGPVGVLTPAEARDKAKGILADVIKGNDPQDDKRKKKGHTLESYVREIYTTWARAHHRNDATAINRIRSSFLPLFGNRKLADITSWNIEKWRSERIKAGISPATANHDVAALKAALRRAVDWGYLQSNPLSTIKPIKTDNKAIVRYLSDDEEARLRVALDAIELRIEQVIEKTNKWRLEHGYNAVPSVYSNHLRPMVILCLNTGLRRGEISNLKWEDIDFDNAMLTVKGQGAKSGQTRHIPLNNKALDTLKN